MRAGEIVGVAGVEGNGQRELVEALAGMRKVVSGRMTLGDLDLTKANPNQTHHAGVGHIPEDREKHGLVASSLADNLVLNEFDQALPYAKGGARQFDAVRSNADALRDEFDIRCSGVGQSAGPSPGNKQKVVVAREMAFKPKLLMAAQPTRGVDVGSIEFIHRRIVDARAGAAVLVGRARRDPLALGPDRRRPRRQGRRRDAWPRRRPHRDRSPRRPATTDGSEYRASRPGAASSIRHPAPPAIPTFSPPRPSAEQGTDPVRT